VDKLNEIDPPNYCIDGFLIHLTQPKHGQQNGKVKQSPDNDNNRKSSKALTTMDCRVSSEPSLQTKNLRHMLAVSLQSNI
jgi:hypothetical protein